MSTRRATRTAPRPRPRPVMMISLRRKLRRVVDAARTARLCAIGFALTKPLVSAGSVSVIRASARRRSTAAGDAPNRPPAATRGAGPYGWGRV